MCYLILPICKVHITYSERRHERDLRSTRYLPASPPKKNIEDNISERWNPSRDYFPDERLPGPGERHAVHCVALQLHVRG